MCQNCWRFTTRGPGLTRRAETMFPRVFIRPAQPRIFAQHLCKEFSRAARGNRRFLLCENFPKARVFPQRRFDPAMRRLFVLAALALCAASLRADSPALTITQQRLPSPAPVGSTAPRFIATPAGPRLTWNESVSNSRPRQFGVIWDHATARFSPPLPLSIKTPSASEIPRVTFPDGSELTAFFPEKSSRILDLHTQRHRDQAASPASPLSAESWPQPTSASAPPEPPLLAAREARVIAIWLNHAEKSPRLFAALSTSAGEQFFLPLRIDDGHPLGRASAVLLRDGSAYITWLESHGSENAAALWLRRLSPSGDLSIPVLITTAPSTAALGHPQLALAKDYDPTPARLLIAHELTTAGITQLVTRLITLPPAESFLQGRPCLSCPPDTATLPGHALTGRVIQLIPGEHQAIIEHSEIPGILPAGKNTFRIDDQTLSALTNDTSLIARIEQRDGVWWLFDITALTTPVRH